MNTSLPSVSFVSLLAVGGALFAAAAGPQPGLALRAADAPVAPPVITLSVKNGTGNYKASGNTGGAKGAAGGVVMRGGNSNSVSSDVKGKAWIEVSVRNSGGAVTGVVVNYDIYVRTSTTTSTGASQTWSDHTGSATVDVDAGKTAVFDSSQIVIDSSISSSSGMGSRGGSQTSSASSITSIYGWYVEAQYNGKPIGRPSENPMGAKKMYESQE